MTAIDREALLTAVEREMSTSMHRLERSSPDGAPRCTCGGYDSTDERLPAAAWRSHLSTAVLARIAVAPPAPLDVERLARAMDRADPPISDYESDEDRAEHRAYAEVIAREYEAQPEPWDPNAVDDDHRAARKW